MLTTNWKFKLKNLEETIELPRVCTFWQALDHISNKLRERPEFKGFLGHYHKDPEKGLSISAINVPNYFSSFANYNDWLGGKADDYYRDNKLFIRAEYTNCITGCYYPVYVIKMNAKDVKISVNDGDDGYMDKFVNSQDVAVELELLKKLAPLCMYDLKSFGYEIG